MKKAITTGFTDFKSADANEMGLLAFCFITGLLLLCAACVIYLIFIEGKTIEVWLLAPIALAGEVITGLVTLVHAGKIDADMENNDVSSVKKRMAKGKKQGYTLFCIFFVIILVSTLFASDLI